MRRTEIYCDVCGKILPYDMLPIYDIQMRILRFDDIDYVIEIRDMCDNCAKALVPKIEAKITKRVKKGGA